MRRLARHLFTLCSALSLLLCVVVTVFWVRSHSYAESVERAAVIIEGRRAYDHLCIDSNGGKLIGWRAWATATPGLGDRELTSYREYRIAGVATKQESVRQWRTSAALYSILRRGSFRQHGDVPPVARGGLLFALGFGLGRAGNSGQEIIAAKRSVMVPHWSVVVLTAVLPAVWSGAVLKRWQRKRNSRCVECDYDLRASPERCPECGAVRAPNSRA